MKPLHQIVPSLMRKPPQRSAHVASLDALPADDLVRAAWEHLAGKPLAARTRPLRIYQGRLIVEVPERSWQHNLRRYEGALLERVNRLLGQKQVSDVEWRVNPELAAGPPRKPPARQTEALDASLAKAAEAIGDPELRELFLKTAERIVQKPRIKHG